jgi:hypothetical protein
LRDPKIPIKGFTNDGEKCIDLNAVFSDRAVTPDFGFDVNEI